MATKLIKEITREAMSRNGAPLLVTLCPGDVISFRYKGKRTRFELSIGHALNLAKLITIEKMYQEKLEEYNRKRKAGMRVKRPKRPSLFMNKMYHRALKSGQ